MEDQHHQFQVRVGDGAARIGEADQLPDDVGGPIHLSGKFNAVSIWVDPDPPQRPVLGIYVAYARHGPVDKLDKVGRAGCHLDAHTPPEFNILVELGGEVGRDVLGSLGAGKGNLHGVEVPNGPRHGQVHRADLPDEALQIID